jgi:NADH-quinone oxidoreductase subunit F
MMRMMDRIVQNKASLADIALMEQVCAQVAGHTICAFGDAAAWPIQGLMRAFRPLVEQRALDHPQHAALAQAAE